MNFNPLPVSLANLVRSHHGPRAKLTDLAFTNFVKALVEDKQSIPDLMEETGLCRAMISRLVHCFRRAELIYRCENTFGADGKLSVMQFKFGPGKKDLPLGTKTSTEVSRTLRNKRKLIETIGRMAGPPQE